MWKEKINNKYTYTKLIFCIGEGIKVMKPNKILKITHNSVFIVITLILGYFGRLSILPVFPFLKLDFSDIPVFLVTLISGIPSGIIVLLVSSSFRALMFSSAGWAGFIIRLTSLVVILSTGVFNKCNSKILKFFGISLGVIICLFLKLIINYFLWINLFFISPEVLNKFMFPIIIPYNLIKLLTTIVLAFYLEKPIRKLLNIPKNY